MLPGQLILFVFGTGLLAKMEKRIKINKTRCIPAGRRRRHGRWIYLIRSLMLHTTGNGSGQWKEWYQGLNLSKILITGFNSYYSPGFPENALTFKFMEKPGWTKIYWSLGIGETKLIAAHLLTAPGIPMLYAGQEVGELQTAVTLIERP